MHELNLNGELNYNDVNVKFSFKKNALTIMPSGDIHCFISTFKEGEKIELLKGKTTNNSIVIFLDLEGYMRYPNIYPEYKVTALLLSNSHDFDGIPTINSISLEKGILNNFGDIFEDTFYSHHGVFDVDNFDGVFKFETKPFKETNIEFKVSTSNDYETYSFNIFRATPLNVKTIENIYRVFTYKSSKGFPLTKSVDIMIDMLNFLKLLSWNKKASVKNVRVGYIDGHDKIRNCGVLYVNLEPCMDKIVNISLYDYSKNLDAFAKLYSLSKKISKSHIFLLEEKHLSRSFDAKEILNTIITFEQLIDHFKLAKSRMNKEEKQLRNTIIKEYNEKLEVFKDLKSHINNYRGSTLKDTLIKTLDDNIILKDNLVSKSSIIDSYEDLKELIEKIVVFRNNVVHSSKFDIGVEGLADGAMIITYINYYLILNVAGYSDTEACDILNKLFKF